jgi:hypothetical protein
MSIASRIFIGSFPTGLNYADRKREKHGDWAKLARLRWDTLELEFEKDCPEELKDYIRKDAAILQAKAGDEYPWTTTQTITLGYALKGKK